MSEKTRKSILVQGSILAMAGLITKIIGFCYRIPMANIMGNTGNGLYSVAFGIYNIALTLSSYSMPLAISKLISERLSKGRYKDANRLFNRALLYAAFAGIIACLVVSFGADGLARFYNRPGLERPLRVLAPTTFVVAILGSLRGYYQGHRTMVPTALSQIIEQIVNAIVSVAAAQYFVSICTVRSDMASMGAMGGTLGTLMGALSALIVFVILMLAKDRNKIKAELTKDDEPTENDALIFKCIILTVIPIIISQTIYQFGYTLDDILFGKIMSLKNVDTLVSTDMQGVFNTQYNQMINLPVSIATAMASATLPSIVASFTIGETKSLNKKIDTVLKVNMLIAIPSAYGLAVLADPIMSVLFPGLKEYHNLAVTLLITGSSAVVFYALSTLTTSILQGCNKMHVPVIHSGISLVIHGLLVGGLLYFTDLGVYALIIGNVSFPLIVCSLNVIRVKKLLNYKFDIHNIFLKPLLSGGVMAFGIYVVYHGLIAVFDKTRTTELVALMVSVFVAVAIYAVMLMVCKVFDREELASLPVIKKFIKN